MPDNIMQEKSKRHIRLGNDGELLEPVEVVAPTAHDDYYNYEEQLKNINYLQEPSNRQKDTSQETAEIVPVWIVSILILFVWGLIAYIVRSTMSSPYPIKLEAFLGLWFPWVVLATIIGYVITAIIDTVVLWSTRDDNSLQVIYFKALWTILKWTVLFIGTVLVAMFTRSYYQYPWQRRRW